MFIDTNELRQECKELAFKLGQKLLTYKLVLATAESCTGGLIGSFITDVPGSSSWFDRGFITYTNKSKSELLGVQADTLVQFGAVSSETAFEMVNGALSHSDANIAVSVTGIAGPTGGSKEKPVGTVCFGFAHKGQLIGNKTVESKVETKVFAGDREQVRLQTVKYALQQLCEIVTN